MHVLLRALLAIGFAMAGCGKNAGPPEKLSAAEAGGASERVQLPPDPWLETRLAMVEQTIAARGISDPALLTALRMTPRHDLVPPAIRAEAYEDRPLPIGFGLTISQPYIVAAMTEAARVRPGSRVLEIGTGSGYQAAVLALMGATVYTIELHEELALRTHKVLERIGLAGIHTKIGDGWYGWAEAAPFDAILVTCATPVLPDRLLAQLAIGGRMVAPIGDDTVQVLEVITKTSKTAVERESLMHVRFGPMLGVVEVER
jgi:protein-L-isoaspartate(D-aspartate) O-methyltransferase